MRFAVRGRWSGGYDCWRHGGLVGIRMKRLDVFVLLTIERTSRMLSRGPACV